MKENIIAVAFKFKNQHIKPNVERNYSTIMQNHATLQKGRLL